MIIIIDESLHADMLMMIMMVVFTTPSLQYGEALEMLSVVPVERQFTYQFSFDTKYLIWFSTIFWFTYFVQKIFNSSCCS